MQKVYTTIEQNLSGSTQPEEHLKPSAKINLFTNSLCKNFYRQLTNKIKLTKKKPQTQNKHTNKQKQAKQCGSQLECKINK